MQHFVKQIGNILVHIKLFSGFGIERDLVGNIPLARVLDFIPVFQVLSIYTDKNYVHIGQVFSCYFTGVP